MKKSISAISLAALAAAALLTTGIAEAGMNMEDRPAGEKPLVHPGTGIVRKIDASTVTLSHAPIASLNWPAMTMSFRLKDSALSRGIRAGDPVDFELVRSQNMYLVTRLSIRREKIDAP